MYPFYRSCDGYALGAFGDESGAQSNFISFLPSWQPGPAWRARGMHRCEFIVLAGYSAIVSSLCTCALVQGSSIHSLYILYIFSVYFSAVPVLPLSTNCSLQNPLRYYISLASFGVLVGLCLIAAIVSVAYVLVRTSSDMTTLLILLLRRLDCVLCIH